MGLDEWKIESGTNLYEKNSEPVIGLEKYMSTSYRFVISIHTYICVWNQSYSHIIKIGNTE